ncbi:hypothetical protein Ddc_10192 [Ditylenchus destructor]|nr:hypothetical protein Ddc_10192 [Ditylenchus destructor]
MTRNTHASKLFLKDKLGVKKLVSYDLDDSEDHENPADIKDKLQKMEILEKKLKIQRNICAFAVIFTVAFYFLIWYFSDCWALPFQKSPCKQPRTLPLFRTNQSTLAEAVDEFVSKLQPQVTKYHLAVEMILSERQAFFNATKNEIGQLLSLHSADLVAFGALKREDERLKRVKNGIEFSYLMIPLFLAGFLIITGCIIVGITESKHSGMDNKETVTEKMENSQNARLKKLKRRIRYLYIPTLICIAAELALFSVFLTGIYSGNIPLYQDAKVQISIESCRTQKNLKEKEFFCDYLSFLTQLNSSLEESCVGIKDALSSHVLEIRQMAWHYESKAIATAIDHYYDLKQYHVDRRVMPLEIGNVLPDSGIFFIVILPLILDFVFFYGWATAEGSVWHVFKCFRIDRPE